MSPPPLPHISAAEILKDLMALTGDANLVREVGAAIDANVDAKNKASRAATKYTIGTPGKAWQGATNEPGSPNNPLSTAEAQALFDELSKLDYIPFDYPVDGCFARAHEMCRIMEERGMATSKIWNYADTSVLSVPGTPFGDITWGYHVAPIVNVKGDDGITRQMVFDPSLGKSPMTFGDWQKAQAGPGGQRLETTDSQPFYYKPSDVHDRAKMEGAILTDPTYKATNATLEYQGVQRDLIRLGLK